MDKRTKLVWLSGLVMTICLFMAGTSTAKDVTITPYIMTSGEYNDNILFTREDKKDDFSFDIAPGLKAKYLTELMNIDAVAAIRFINYASETDLDRNDQYYDLLGSYEITEKLQFRGRFYYMKDATVESTIYDIDETGLDEPNSIEPGIESFFSERKQYNGWASLNYDLTELTNVELGYRYLQTDYDFEGNADYETNKVEFRVLRQLEGYRDQVGAKISYDEQVTDTTNNDNYRFSLLWNHVFTETLRLNTEVGVRYTETTQDWNAEQDDNWNGIANIRLTRRGETNLAEIGFRQELRTSSEGFPVNESRLDWKYQQELTERFLFRVKGYCYLTKEEGDSAFDEDTVFFDIIPILSYLITENHSVSLGYGYSIEYDRALEDNEDAQRNRVWLVFEFGFPQKW